ncbi:MAG TPA: hypothetical protein VGS11_10785 [Candidatus Bathyarchaeia archaeon]|nr:hypothetical protein [Candidatus Bathyarchaeia archaeon]
MSKKLSEIRDSSPNSIFTGRHSPIVHKRRAISLGAVVLGLVIVVAAVAVIFIELPPPKQVTINLPGGSTTSSTTGVAAACTGLSASVITLNFADGLAGGSSTPTTVKIVPDAGVVVGGQPASGKTALETVTISSGTGNTANQYPCGAGLSVYEVLSGSETMYWHTIAPGATPSQIQGKNFPALNLLTFAAPTLKFLVLDDAGNSYTSGTSIANFSAKTGNTANNFWLNEATITFTVTITNTVANSGFASSYDPINLQNWCSGLLMKENGTTTNTVGVTGFPTSGGALTVGSTRYWQATIPDGFSSGVANPILSGSFANTGFTTNCASYSAGSGGLSSQKQAGSNTGGVWTFKFSVSKGSMAHGNTLVLTPSAFEYYDPAYALSNSASGGTTAAQYASAFFHLKIGA